MSKEELENDSEKVAITIIDIFIKTLSFFIISIGAVIYCFALGYFNKLGIPDYPSFYGAISFFAQNSGRLLTGSNSHCIISGIILLTFCLVILNLIYFGQIKISKKWIFYLLISVMWLLAIWGLYLTKILAPVITIIILPLILIIFFKSGVNRHLIFLYTIVVVVFITVFCLSYSLYDVDKLKDSDDLSLYFSRGTNLEISDVSSWLIWSGDKVATQFRQ
ncbi:MAG: hypothetical protein HQK50_07040 [Oligoflexia bacterium]|nr:hypothetical protein [Oligoflexia bacterium]